MKIIGEKFDTEENILKLINTSAPSSDTELTFKHISEMAGWVYVKGNAGKTEFSVNFSSAVFDTSIFIQFFAQIVNLKDAITVFLDYEGSYPMLYAEKRDKDTVRFIFAHDYILHKNDEDYEDCLRYKIEFDILISKTDLLKKFYMILYQYLKNYDVKHAYYDLFNITKAEKYKHKIKSYLDKNMTTEEKALLEKKCEDIEELGDWTKEMLKPENLIGPFNSTEEMMKSLWDDD